VRFFTVHASGGPKMIEDARAAIDKSGRRDLKMLAVTVLTSHDRDSLDEIGYEHAPDPSYLADDLARMALNNGAHGIVCAPTDLSRFSILDTSASDSEPLRSPPRMFPEGTDNPFFVCPGVRFADGDVDDQKRVSGPREAIAAGADYLVIGRPIRNDKNPQKAAQRFVDAIGQGVADRRENPGEKMRW